MRRPTFRHLFLLAAVLSAACGEATGPDDGATIVVESVVDLEIYPGFARGHANAVNAEGYVVGWQQRTSGGALWPAIWSPDGAVSLIDTAAGCTPLDINTARWVVGQCSTGTAVLWRQPNERTVLDPVAGPYGCAYGINESGQAVGITDRCTNCTPWAVVWEPDGSPRFVEPLPGDLAGSGSAINGSGHVAGFSAGPAADPYDPWVDQAVLWRGAGAIPLGILAGYDMSQAVDVNDSDVVVGDACLSSCFAPNGTRVFIWENGTLKGIGPRRSSSAAAINNEGVVALNSAGHAWLWARGTLVQLTPLSGATSCRVSDINDAGHAVGACFWDGNLHAVRWTVRVEG